jgi:hypothetical protein
LDLFDNPVGYRTSLSKMHCILLVFTGICSETEVSEQLYWAGVIRLVPKHRLISEQVLALLSVGFHDNIRELLKTEVFRSSLKKLQHTNGEFFI